MDGVAAVRSVLVADSAMTALVPAAKIIAGPLPLGIQPPAVSLQSISKVDLNVPSPGATRMVSERVQVTVMAANYPSQKSILRAVRHAAADQLYPTVPGISGVTIHTDSAGPDMTNDESSLWIGSQDFFAKYTEQR